MLNLVKALPGVTIPLSDFDANPYVLNTLSGTIDLRTGAIQNHNHNDLIAKVVPYEVESGTPERFIQFLGEIFDTPEIIKYVLTLLGYSLSGLRLEHALFLLFGNGRNGKSTLLEVISTILGEYALALSPDVLFGKDSHSTGLTDIAGKRFIFVDDPERNSAFNVSMIKRLTGNEIIRARRMRADYVDVHATHKLWVAVNYRPTVAEQDDGIWDRIKLLPCPAYFSEAKKDTALKSKLLAEAPKILSLLVGAAKEYFSVGLRTPEVVNNLVLAYKQEMDLLAPFMRDCVAANPEASTSLRDMYEAYKIWCVNNHEEMPLKFRIFNRALVERKFTQGRVKGRDSWLGLRLISKSEALINTALAHL
jgi:putative DNA primase/helicase